MLTRVRYEITEVCRDEEAIRRHGARLGWRVQATNVPKKRLGLWECVQATFLVMDALALMEFPEVFDNVIDSGLLHVFNDEDRRRYVDGLAAVLKPGGRLFLLCFSDEEPGTQGPRRVPKKELHAALSAGWAIESIEPSRYEVRPDLKDISFSEGGPKAWFVVVKRTGCTGAGE